MCDPPCDHPEVTFDQSQTPNGVKFVVFCKVCHKNLDSKQWGF